MNRASERAGQAYPPVELTETEPFAAFQNPPAEEYESYEQTLPELEAESGAGGRQVLGWALIAAAAIWIAFAAWSAGQSLDGAPLTGPVLAQWLAIATGPLALLGLVWLLFGRTRRQEAERFTRSVAAMHTEARSLEGLLAVLRRRLDDEGAAMAGMSDRLMRLGDEAAHRLGGVTRDLETGADKLAQHSLALDRAAENARTDLGVLLEDLPRAEATARAMSEELRGSGREASAQASSLEAQLAAVTARAREADESVGGASQRLVAHLTQIESAGAAAATRVSDVAGTAAQQVDELLDRTAGALGEIRAGIDTQSAAVTALVAQSAAGLGRIGIEAADALNQRLSAVGGALDGLSGRLAQQDRASQAMVAGVERSLAELDQRFVDLAAEGDLRAGAIASAIARVRGELDQGALQSASSDGSLDALERRTEALRGAVTGLHQEIGERLNGALDQAQGGAERLLAAVNASRPEIEWMRDAAGEASQRLVTGADGLQAQQDRLASFLALLDDGVGTAEQRLAGLSQALAATESDAARLQAETGPALVQAMVQVRDASAHAAERDREVIAAVIPEGAARLSQQTRDALERAIRESITAQLQDVEAVATRAVEAARSASDRLTQQMLTIGQTAAALETHISQTQEADRAADSEAFARRTAMLIDSMHSAAIDVGKILSDEVDERAWGAYLKGDRGVFTRRAVRLMNNGENRSLVAHYEQDREFQTAANRFVHDFEAMLRRVVAERDGGVMAVTLMSSDVGKLYAALIPVVEKRR